MIDLKEIHKDRLKIHFLKPEGKISRRQFLMTALPQYEVVPFVESTLCRGYQECGLCIDTCPHKAIKIVGDKVKIDTALCTGCGTCIEACPSRAIVYPTFSLEELDKEMEGLLLTKDSTLDTRVIAAVCKRCWTTYDRDSTAGFSYPASVIPLSVPCLAMVSPWLILRAFDMGAQGFALFGGRKCHSGLDSVYWQENVRFVQELLGCWGIEAERIRIFDAVAEEPGGIEPELDKFAQEMAELGPTPLSMSEPALVPTEGPRLPALVRGIGNKLGSPSKGVVIHGAVPFGKVEMDSSRCTGCGLCALDCPSGALSVSSSGETEVYQLLFKQDSCIACGRCAEVCPEKCLHLEHILELDKIDSPATKLFEDVIVQCSQCGNPIASKAMIDKVRAKILDSGQSFPYQFELCPACKVRAQFNLERVI